MFQREATYSKMPPSNHATDRRTFLGGLVGLPLGSILPEQTTLGIDERTVVTTDVGGLHPSLGLNFHAAIAVGNQVAVGCGNRAECTLGVEVLRGRPRRDDAVDHEAYPNLAVDALAHHSDAGYYSVGANNDEGSGAYLRRSRTGSDAGWIQSITALELDGYEVAEYPAALETTDDGGVVVAGNLRFDAVEEDDASDDESGDSLREQRQIDLPVSASDVVADGPAAESWVAKYGPSGEREWRHVGIGDVLLVTTEPDRPRVLLSASGPDGRPSLVQLTFDDGGGIARVDANSDYGSPDDIDRVGDRYRAVHGREFFTFDDRLELVDEADSGLLRGLEGSLAVANEDGYLLRGTDERMGVERTVLAKYDLDGERRWKRTFSGFDEDPAVVDLQDGYGVAGGGADLQTRLVVVEEGAPLQYWGLLGTAGLGAGLIARASRGGDTDD